MGNMLYGNYFYVYTHGRYSHRIVFELRIEIEGNEELINREMKKGERK